jgi:hypothetical protein
VNGHRRLAAGIAVASFALVVVTSAVAQQGSQGPGSSSVSQYVETIPTSEGSKAVGVQQPKDPSSSAVSQYVETIPTGEGSSAVGAGARGSVSGGALERIARSSAYGAPASTAAAGAQPGRADVAVTSTPGATRVIGTAVEAIGDGSRARLVALAAVLIATTAGLLAVAASRRPR